MTNLPISDLTRRRGGFLFALRCKEMMMRTPLILILLLSAAAFAQPQAPIEWGEERLLQDASDEVDILVTDGWARGDTIILMGASQGPGSDLYSMVSLSGNNGQSWSPWHVFVSPNNMGAGGNCWAVATDQLLYISARMPSGFSGLYATTDLGLTWNDPQGSVSNFFQCQVLNDTIYGFNFVGNQLCVTWTGDGGRTFAPNRFTSVGFDDAQLAVGPNYIHVAKTFYDSGSVCYYERAPRIGGPFEDLRTMNLDLAVPTAYGISINDQGIGILATVSLNYPRAYFFGALFRNRTTDDGTGWSPMDTIMPNESAGAVFGPRIAHCGPLWMIAWFDTTRMTPFEEAGIWVQFSANGGRSWYPSQQAMSEYGRSGSFSAVDIRPSFIRLYTIYLRNGGDLGMWYYQNEGLIRADIETPILESAISLPQLIPVDTVVQFNAHAHDNDSLWLMQVVLRQNEQADSIALDLNRDSDSSFSVFWNVPDDTAEWFYYYRAEDMWENISYYPTEGPLQPWIVNVGSINATSGTSTPHVSPGSSIFPNPANGVVTITGILPRHRNQAELVVYDLLGKEVTRITVTPSYGDSYRISWNLTSSSHSPLASGIYFLAQNNSVEAKPIKFLIVR